MAKVSDIQLRAQAVILAQEGYSYTIIGQKLKRSKRWVGKWVSRCLKNPIFVDKSRCGRPKVLSNVAKRFIRSAKYKRGQSLRRMAQQLTARGEAASKNSIRDYMRKELHWKSWRRKKQPLLTESHKKRRIKFAQEHKHWTVEDWSDVLFTDESPFKVFYVPNSRNDTVWGLQENNVPRTDQMKFSPSVMVWGGNDCSWINSASLHSPRSKNELGILH